MSIRGILVGSLTLIALHTLVAYEGPSKRLEELAGPRGLLVRIVEGFLSPAVPGIPDRAARQAAAQRVVQLTADTLRASQAAAASRYPAPVYSGPPPGGVPGRQNP